LPPPKLSDLALADSYAGTRAGDSCFSVPTLAGLYGDFLPSWPKPCRNVFQIIGPTSGTSKRRSVRSRVNRPNAFPARFPTEFLRWIACLRFASSRALRCFNRASSMTLREDLRCRFDNRLLPRGSFPFLFSREHLPLANSSGIRPSDRKWEARRASPLVIGLLERYFIDDNPYRRSRTVRLVFSPLDGAFSGRTRARSSPGSSFQ